MNRLTTLCTIAAAVLANLAAAPQAHAQWTHRYAKLEDFGHHIYLEQHELPILAHGPMDPAPAAERSVGSAARRPRRRVPTRRAWPMTRSSTGGSGTRRSRCRAVTRTRRSPPA